MWDPYFYYDDQTVHLQAYHVFDIIDRDLLKIEVIFFFPFLSFNFLRMLFCLVLKLRNVLVLLDK